MPNLVRNKIFTEFAMETARDSIKYLKPILTKTQHGKDLNNRATDQSADDPFGYKDEDFSNEAKKYHKSLYEITDDRYVQELINLSNRTALTAVDATAGTFTLGDKLADKT